MKLVHTKEALKEAISLQKEVGNSIGFVPTMGALHRGHLSLMKQAGEQTGFVVVSIFVNPTQFNNKSDLDNYPRNLNADLAMLKNTPCELVFAPSANEMYPEEDTRQFNFGKLGEVMEGEHRPGHFNGVAQIVSKLFDAVQPDKAFFGMKDFQQLAIIQNMTTQLGYHTEIVPCDIVREPDGLAMSSRNKRLTAEQQKNATVISKTLFEAVKKTPDSSVDEIKNWVVSTIDANPYLETEYFDIVDNKTLQSITHWNEAVNKIGCIAVYCGEVRLIDNVKF
ncbi:MAG: pantoate--beta-alanine ligase [Prolixibacteraceae bacterium]|jgi:pantoate--beta-alanine ligase|nr:pantoate--beta-alanine ligase [Prolixibacteraceae bacterium]